jgi:anaerobic selenocysteine-containing dehydrogenase
MTRRINRRQFLQLSGLTGAAVALSGCTINLQKYETLEPYVVPPEEALPGENVWYASACRQCPAGCGIIVRISNGRAKKIEGNPRHPLNRGRLCARGQSGLHVLYNPDRLKNAVTQQPRGSKDFEPLEWDAALAAVAERIKGAQPGGVAFYGRLGDDSLAAIVAPFIKALGGPAPVYNDPLSAMEGRNLLARITGQVFGIAPNVPFFDLAHADVVLSFGANFTETWLSPVAYGKAFGDMRSQPLGKRGTFVQLEPRMSSTGAMADKWVPLSPGTEGPVALAIGKIIVDEDINGASASPYAGVFASADIGGIALMSGVPEERLGEMARLFGSFPNSLALPGGALAGGTNGEAAMQTVMALNALIGQGSGPASLIYLTPAPPDPAFAGATAASYDDALALMDKMAAGEIGVLFVHGNPLFELPVDAGFAQALARVPYVVSFADVVDETAVQADIILPESSYLEGWGYQLISPPAEHPAISGQQPVVQALYDTRQPTDVFLALADLIGGPVKQALPWPNTVDFMKATVTTLVGKPAPYDTASPEKVWAGWRQVGGWWDEGASPETAASTPSFSAQANVGRPVFEGEGGDYPYLLYPYLGASLSDGRGANQPWLQEAPDPMTTASWYTWVEINPETAEELGLDHSDVVKVESPFGYIDAIVYVYPAIRPDVVAVPVGEGHSEYGRFAAGYGANVFSILPPQSSGGQWPWASTRVRLTRLDRETVLPRIENNIGVKSAREAGQIPLR